MTLKDLFVLARSGMEVIITEVEIGEKTRVVYSGSFWDFPYKYADCVVSEFYISEDNKLVIDIFN